MWHKIRVFIVVFITTLSISKAQEKGKIAGKVTDAGTSEELIGVAVGIKGTSAGASTDIEGRYNFQLDPGTYTIIVSYVGYKSKEITDVVVEPGKVTQLDVVMEESVVETEEVVVTATFKKESVDALLLERKNAVSVSDGISSDLIRKTPDRNTSDILKRVSGATIQDNKFAVIRGLNERYNSAFINNSPLPSSEPDRKAFAFDIFPANIVESMNIYKTATPDLPGDFAGGVIKIKTRDIPDEDFQTVSVGVRGNSISTFKEGLTYKGGKTDFLGIDDGTRKLPSDFPSLEANAFEPNYTGVTEESQKGDKSNIAYGNARDAAQSLTNNWNLTPVPKLAPGYNLQYTLGKKIGKFAAIASISYNRTIRRVEGYAADKDRNGAGDFVYKYNDSQNNDDVLWGGMLNLAYKITDNHKITLKNSYNINSSDQTTLRQGQLFTSSDTYLDQKINNTYFIQNRLVSTQIGGEHFVKSGKFKIDWNGGFGNMRRQVPDYKVLTYSRPGNSPENTPYQINSNLVDPRSAGRFYSDLKEELWSAGVDVAKPLPTVGFIKSEIKVGAFFQERNRGFDARQLIMTRHPGFSNGYTGAQVDSIQSLSPDQIFSKPNFDYQYNKIDPNDIIYTVDDQGNIIATTKDGQPLPPTFIGTYTLKESTTKTDSYRASARLTAFYFMLDHRITQYLRVTWGFRNETYNQKLSSVITNINKEINLNTTKSDWLPSVNLTVSPIRKANVRLSYSKTLNRPEFRELAPFIFYDFAINRAVVGNDALQRALINNYDARLEFFPGAGQVISVTYFYKYMNNPIERYLDNSTSTPLVFYDNALWADIRGFEFEFRQNLQFINSTSNVFKRFTVNGNYSIFDSEAQANAINTLRSEGVKRPLQGQSRYIANGGISFDHEEAGISASVLVNRVGRRIAFIGDTYRPNIWENPRTILDFQIAKYFFKRKLETKINVSDLLAQKQIFYMDLDKDGQLDPEKDFEAYRYRYGTNITLSVGYTF